MSAPDLDKISWKHLKLVVKNNECLKNIVNIANTYIDLEHWPTHFKMSLSIIISKPNKTIYNSPKSFYLIVLLNMLEKFSFDSE